jgi:hypothetical protein
MRDLVARPSFCRHRPLLCNGLEVTMSQSPPVARPFPQRRKPKLVPMWQRFDRFVGLDIHKEFLTIVILDAAQNVVLSLRKLS